MHLALWTHRTAYTDGQLIQFGWKPSFQRNASTIWDSLKTAVSKTVVPKTIAIQYCCMQKRTKQFKRMSFLRIIKFKPFSQMFWLVIKMIFECPLGLKVFWLTSVHSLSKSVSESPVFLYQRDPKLVPKTFGSLQDCEGYREVTETCRRRTSICSEKSGISILSVV